MNLGRGKDFFNTRQNGLYLKCWFICLLVNGGLTSWSTWTTCTETCGTGTRTRTKTCTNPLPQNGGKDCTGLGDTQQQEDCNTQNCPGNVFQEKMTSSIYWRYIQRFLVNFVSP